MTQFCDEITHAHVTGSHCVLKIGKIETPLVPKWVKNDQKTMIFHPKITQIDSITKIREPNVQKEQEMKVTNILHEEQAQKQ